MTNMFFRTIIVYILLLLVLRLMGKRQIGELQPSELVTTLLLSEIASQPIVDDNIPLVYGVVPVVVILSLEVIISFVVTKSQILKKVFDGTPSILIRRGVLDQKEMKKVRLSLEELIGELRLKNISDISQVEYAILEQNGQLSVISTAAASTVKVKDLHLNVSENGISHPLIIDGNVSDYNMRAIGKSEAWLQKTLEKKKIKRIKDVFLLTCDDADNVTVVRKYKE